MDMQSFLYATVVAGTPLLYATLGEILTEKAGNLNLGVEGMMLLGAVVGFVTAFFTKNPYLAVISAMAAGAAGALFYTFLTVTLKSNQVVTGLALTIFGTGFSGLLGKTIMGEAVPEDFKAFFSPIKLPFLGDIPYVGKVFFSHDILVYLSYICVALLGMYIYTSGSGLKLRAVGENPASADAAGINVTLYKYINLLIGGALCGIGGAYLSLVYVPSWQDNITSGRGWIAVALVIFSSWNPYRAILGAYIFGGLDIIGFRLENLIVSKYIFDMLPYAATIVLLTVFSAKKSRKNSPPENLGAAYFREER
jgi:general nucleoside transport system permease protein